jgi:hypothetical protein
MAKYHGQQHLTTINAVDLKAAIAKTSLKFKVDTGDVSNAGGAGKKEYVEGMSDATLDLSGPADFGAGLQDATVFALIGGGATAWKVKASTAATGATNPEYSQSAIMTDYSIDFDIGGPVTYSVSGQRTGATTRATA